MEKHIAFCAFCNKRISPKNIVKYIVNFLYSYDEVECCRECAADLDLDKEYIKTYDTNLYALEQLINENLEEMNKQLRVTFEETGHEPVYEKVDGYIVRKMK